MRPAGGNTGENDALSLHGRIRVQQPHAVRTDRAHAVSADFLEQLLLEGTSDFIPFCKAGGNDDERFDSTLRAFIDDPQHGVARHGNDCQIDRFRKLRDRCIRADGSDDRCLGIDRIDGSLKAIQNERLQNSVTNAGRLPRCADHSNSGWLEEPAKRGSRKNPIPHFRAVDAGLGWQHGEINLEIATVEPFGQRKTGMAEDFNHAAIVQLSDCPESSEAGPGCEQRKSFQQVRADTLALKPILDRKCHLG